MRADELRQKSDEELREQVSDLRARVRQMRFDIASGKIKNMQAARQTKRDIARILTILNERSDT